ncbi:Ig-like domain-containing protein [Lacticaseibacillus sharpeae]|uniref:Bacterial Ig domain-containing protein n=1 Tax=Lacticaseibacillus sharpeae JCM 1186 = DSM 20505 TaxID=1291052 RepID=A0A0R1ZTM9_9LACO|nr:Ig-like domain-containing protein [Lacticaseibacillus sharpeae]KRM55081.1 hypothetical protein FC18_GL001682 [Lacticaseibacillus sharpeae JCM 1186 = DSM 20505]
MNALEANAKFTVYAVREGKQSAAVTVTVSPKASDVVQAPSVTEISEAEDTITGTGQAGTTVEVSTTEDFRAILGSALVDNLGRFSVEIGQQKANTQLYLRAKLNDKYSDVIETTVTSTTTEIDINDQPLTEKTTSITGFAPVGSSVRITDSDKKVLGVDVADEGNEGNGFTIALNRALKAGEQITVTSTLNDTVLSKSYTVQKSIANIVLDKNESGNSPAGISGTGQPGATLTVDKNTADGPERLDAVIIGDDGKFNIRFAEKQDVGTELVLNSELNEVPSEELSAEVLPFDHATINAESNVQVVFGTVTKKGNSNEPIDEVQLLNGTTLIGIATPNSDGTFAIAVPDNALTTDTLTVKTISYDGYSESTLSGGIKLSPADVYSAVVGDTTVTGYAVDPSATLDMYVIGSDGKTLGKQVGVGSSTTTGNFTINVTGGVLAATNYAVVVNGDVNNFVKLTVVAQKNLSAVADSSAKTLKGTAPSGTQVVVQSLSDLDLTRTMIATDNAFSFLLSGTPKKGDKYLVSYISADGTIEHEICTAI